MGKGWIARARGEGGGRRWAVDAQEVLEVRSKFGRSSFCFGGAANRKTLALIGCRSSR